MSFSASFSLAFSSPTTIWPAVDEHSSPCFADNSAICLHNCFVAGSAIFVVGSDIVELREETYVKTGSIEPAAVQERVAWARARTVADISAHGADIADSVYSSLQVSQCILQLPNRRLRPVISADVARVVSCFIIQSLRTIIKT